MGLVSFNIVSIFFLFFIVSEDNFFTVLMWIMSAATLCFRQDLVATTRIAHTCDFCISTAMLSPSMRDDHDYRKDIKDACQSDDWHMSCVNSHLYDTDTRHFAGIIINNRSFIAGISSNKAQQREQCAMAVEVNRNVCHSHQLLRSRRCNFLCLFTFLPYVLTNEHNNFWS